MSSPSDDAWQSIIETVEELRRLSSLSLKHPMLQEVLTRLERYEGDNDDVALEQICALLIDSYGTIKDAASLKFVGQILETVAVRDKKYLTMISSQLLSVAQYCSSTKALKSNLNLLDGINSCLGFTYRFSEYAFNLDMAKLVQAQCLVANGIEDMLSVQESKSVNRGQKQHAKRLRGSVLQSITKVYVSCLNFKAGDFGLNVASALTDNYDKSKLPAKGVLVLLGSISKACTQLLSSQPSAYDSVRLNCVQPFCDFISREVILSKSVIAGSCLEAYLKPFMGEFVDEEVFSEHFIANMEKSVLRAPEFGFTTNAVIFGGLDARKIDLCKYFVQTKLMSQTFSSLKSSKENVRKACLSSFTQLLRSLSENNTSCNDLLLLVDELFKNLKTNLNIEYKSIACQILTNIPLIFEGTSKEIVSKLAPYVSKESNESVLPIMLTALFVHLSNIEDVATDMTALIEKGLSDKKLQVRKLWLTGLLANYSGSLFQSEQFTSNIHAFTKDVLSSPQTHDHNAIFACLKYLNEVSRSLQDQERKELFQQMANIGNALVIVTLSTQLVPNKRVLATELLKSYLKYSPSLIGPGVIRSLEVAVSERRENSLISLRFISPVLLSFAQPTEDIESMEKVFIELLALFQFPELLLKFTWADMVIKANLDPGSLIKRFGRTIVDRAKQLSDNHAISAQLRRATIDAVAYAAFINTETIIPLAIDLIKDGLDLESLQKITTEDLNVWRGQEGQLAINVLEEKEARSSAQHRNGKDSETLKWEEEIRKKQAAKRTTTKKLSKDEQDLVDAQLRKESAVRAEVGIRYLRLSTSLNLIRSLTIGASLVENGSQKWYPAIIHDLLAALQEENIWELVKLQGIETYLALSKITSPRLSSLRLFVGLATLRVLGVSHIPENYLKESALDLLSRVLFKIKFAADKKAFDQLTLNYMLPLLTVVLEEGYRVAKSNAGKPRIKSDFVEEDKEEEHLLLALEIISAHAEAFRDSSIPRTNVLKTLLSLLSIPSRARAAKESLMTLSQNISLIPLEDDLTLFLRTLMSPNQFVRASILEALDEEFDLQPFMEFSPEIFILMFDEDESNRETAKFIWELNKFQIKEDLLSSLLNFFNQEDSGLRLFVARAFSSALNVLYREDKSMFEKYLAVLMDYYLEMNKIPEPILDEYGLVVITSEQQKDPWTSRSTVAITLKEFSRFFPSDSESVLDFAKFMIESGSLGDREVIVRQEMKEAGIEFIAFHGSKNVHELVPLFEQAINSVKEDKVKENIIILYGTLAQHLPFNDVRVKAITEKLLEVLESSSEDVQQAVSECIAPLVSSLKLSVSDYVSKLLENLLAVKVPLCSRRGAAWGLAGLVKGFGIGALSEFDITRALMDASEDKRNPDVRIGVAYAFECLSKTLGKFFEPFVIEILPNILKNLGDAVPEVRDATAGATKAIMAHTTSFGVKKLIPVAIRNLDDISWRTKRGSVELLGNMAYLDPTQLSVSLSTIVPQIVAVLNDSHKEVRKAADQSLNRFGEVIRNPEIQRLVPTLIKAIGDPTKYTDEALDALIRTQFVHYIDGPSLALIVHVIHRGMRERSANTKRKSCKIVGNMAILVDAHDLVPYLGQLIEEVEVAMVDPVPNTRATAARALGALVERLGEEQFPNLIPRLLDTLSDESKAGDRFGSAQALAEVISGLGLSKLDEMLPVILAGVKNFRSYIREGFMPLLLFLPVCFGTQFAPYVSQIIQPILAGLADPDDNISDTALKAGKLLVKNYATKAVDLLLPELELGMFDENERIRLSSVQLCADLLFQVTGISSKNEFEDDETEHHSEVTKQMVEVLGTERRDRVLSSLFVCRSDTSGIVRATTVDVWKALVPNTPRTIREILPTLTNLIVAHLASPSPVLRHISAQSLGDMVKRVGGNAMSEILPTLNSSIEKSSDTGSKQGVCIALQELIISSAWDVLVEYQDSIVNIIRVALVDHDLIVREAAASSFDVFQDVFGNVAVDEILPHLLNLLQSPESSEYALLALQEIMSTKSEVIFPILIPTLLRSPVDAFRARALGSLARVAGSALYRHLSLIINALVGSLVDLDSNTGLVEALHEALDAVFCSVVESEGLHPLLQQILSLLKDDNKEKRIVVLGRLPHFFDVTTLDYSVYTADLVSDLVLSFDDSDERVLKGTFETLTILIKKQDKSNLERLVKPSKQALQLAGKSGQELAIFGLPKGPSCILPIFLHGLMYGSNDDRESSAIAIADIVSRTPAANLRPFVTVITGPLIRVVGERFPADIKAAILFALNKLFDKVPQLLRPFIPQLQRTFVKSLSDPSNEKLRLRAARALGSLIEYQPRIDPLVAELVNGTKQSSDSGVKSAMLRALLEVMTKAGDKLSENSKKSIINLVEEQISSVDDKLATAYAKLIGSLSSIMSSEGAKNILADKVLDSDLEGDSGRFGILTLNSFLKHAPQHVFQVDILQRVVEYLLKASDAPSPYISENSLMAIGKLLLLQNENKSLDSTYQSPEPFRLDDADISKLIRQLCKCMLKPESNSLDARRYALVVVRTLARFKFNECIVSHYDWLGTSVFSCLRDIIIPVKLAAEKAYLAIFKLVEDPDMNLFNEWVAQLKSESVANCVGTTVLVRSIKDYTKRVGKRLASVERERIEAGGDPETVFSDRFEDEREIWAVGSVDLSSDD
ncbi:LAMI_0D07624g1_1 [Lachancea mirantina]|uniref:LAMI_0D07624g1_1 n=1 Tax=Lachancea mirantina TaxID=1230905 RepID=A0A1G4JCS3_9SACH|nr:LAMI_0D07624g1_1 [Lachancea mirantina]